MGARLPLLRYVQTLVLHNALGTSLDLSAACLAIGTRTPHIVAGIVHRISLVDPGIKFAVSDPTIADAPRASSTTLDPFLIFCDTHSIVIDEQSFLQALKLAVNKPVPELVALYKLRWQKNSDPEEPTENSRPNRLIAPTKPKPTEVVQQMDQGVQGRKSIALAWQTSFAQILPMSSPKLRTKLAWHLAKMGILTKDDLASLQEDALVHTHTNPTAFVELRTQYLEALPRMEAIKQALARRAAERSRVQTQS